MKLMVLLHN